MSITPEELYTLYPRLYHMAEPDSWESIRKHGLLSTSALLDLYEIGGEERNAIESAHRRNSIPITHPEFGMAVVRDQKPMSIGGLERALTGGLKPQDWFEILNDKVFFWLTEERLGIFMNARAYRDKGKTVLIVDTELLLNDYEDRVLLSSMNSGCTIPFAHPRGADLFLPLSEYRYDYWRKKRGKKDPIVEFSVTGGVQNISDYVIEVKSVMPNQEETTVWQR